MLFAQLPHAQGADSAKSTLLIIIVFLMLSLPGITQSQMLDSLDRVMLDSALAMINLNPFELGFEKTWVEDDTFRLAVVERYLSDPMSFPDYVDETQAAVDSFSRRPLEMLRFISDQLFVDPDAKPTKPPKLTEMAFDSSAPFKLWINAISEAEPLRQKFYSHLDSLDLHDLIMASPPLWSEDDDSIKGLLEGSWQHEFGIEPDTSRKVDGDRLLDIIKKLDINALTRAGMIVLPAAQMTARGIAAETIGLSSIEEGSVDGVSGDVLYYSDNEWGRFVVGGSGDNIYFGDFTAIIDIGGDDVYRGRCGAAMGVLSQPYSLLIDLAGNDYYDGAGKDINHGAGFFGIGVLIDRGGDDVYRSANYAQGSGLFGIGVLADHGGADDRRGGYFMQGSGHCGIGMLIDDGDETSDDRYLSSCWAQGFASTFGYGLLFDSGGDDTYRTGGAYLHAPLLPHDYRSFSGGFGMGWRPRAGGGIGVLYDKGEGNDFYDAEVMSFGSSYWYSIGILIDGGGNDYYSLAHYGLGVGIHLSLGALYEMDGDDQYRSRYGVVGGTPHDLSVGMMVDGGGNDNYLVSDGWGASLTNSFGLFIDRLGDDTYGTRGGTSFGKVRWARGFAGAAIFMDLEGEDVYTSDEVARDSTIWIQSGWGIGIDLERDVVATEREEEVGEITLTAEDSAKTVEELFKDASQWEVGSARESVARARKALLTKGAEAVHYIIDNKLNTRSSLESRLLDQIVNAMPDTAGTLLLAQLPEAAKSDDERILINVVGLLGKIKWEPAVDPLLDMVDRKSVEKARNSIISALGRIGEKRAAVPISRYVDDKQERRRIITINALKSLEDTTTIEAIIKSLDDPMFTVRSAALMTAASFGPPAMPYLKDYLASDKAKYPELGLYAIGRIAQNLSDSTDAASRLLRYEAIRLFEKYLDHDKPQMRAEAVVAIYRNGGEVTRQIVDARMESEYSPVVLAAYRRMQREMAGK